LQIYSGKNNLKDYDKVYQPKPGRNPQIMDGYGNGKRQNIPVESCILARSDSAERLGLRDRKIKGYESQGSPAQQLVRRLFKERNQNELYSPVKLPEVSEEKRR
jgi:hypothetical protein